MNVFYIGLVLMVLYACSERSSPSKENTEKQYKIGDQIDSLNYVAVYYNGKNFRKSQGKHYAKDGYYYGQKGQCVEFVKRYYHDALQHSMPNVWGNAIDFFNHDLRDDSMNNERGLLQFKNGSTTPPKVNDLIVFNYRQYGHVAIVSKLGHGFIEVIQQNVGTTSRRKHQLQFICANKNKDGFNYFIDDCIGWLRLP